MSILNVALLPITLTLAASSYRDLDPSQGVPTQSSKDYSFACRLSPRTRPGLEPKTSARLQPERNILAQRIANFILRYI